MEDAHLDRVKALKCPHCNGKNIVRYGKYDDKQIYYCKDCRKKFIDKELKNKSYNAKVIINAITYYNLGHTLDKSAKLINQRFKVRTSKSSVHSWVKEFSDVCTYGKLRSQVVKKYGDEILLTHCFRHHDLLYNFKYHKPKLEILCKYPSLVQYLKNLGRQCPDDIFKDNKRCSQLLINVKIKKEERYNHACRLAGLALKACSANKERHTVVESFMLINDSSTIAVEVPVWFWEKNLDLGISGHIDILQVRQGKIFVLDFKPLACKEKDSKVASQLYLYASGLSFRTRIPLKDFRCAWFDKNVYYEFNPMDSKVKIKNA